jgi:hypothetical protein
MLLAVSGLSNRRKSSRSSSTQISFRGAYGLSGSREPYAGHHGAPGERRRRGSGAAPSNPRRCIISTESVGAAGSKAATRGRSFPSYGCTLAKLLAALAGTKSPSELIPAVYDVREILDERGKRLRQSAGSRLWCAISAHLSLQRQERCRAGARLQPRRQKAATRRRRR